MFGNTDPVIFAFWLLIALISMFVTTYLRSKGKYKAAAGTPVHFSLSFMTVDNLQKFIVSFFLAYIGLRASSVYFQKEASLMIAIGIGPASEVIANFFRKQESKARE